MQPDGFQLFTQPCHIDCQCVFIYKAVGLPEPLHQQITADHLSLSLQKRLQNPVIILCQLQALSLVRKARICSIEHRSPASQRFLRFSKIIRPPQNRLNLCGQYI